MSKLRIALITNWFPPISGVATNRMVSFAQFLSDEYELEVFTLGTKKEEKLIFNKIKTYYHKQSSIHYNLRDLSGDGQLKHYFKVGSRILLHFFSNSGLSVWKKKTLKKLEEINREKPFDILISSSAPPEAHQVAIGIIKKNPTLIWIADMRDEMSKNPFISEKMKIQLVAIEAEVNKYAKAITTVSMPILNDFKVICPNIEYFEEIRNGYNHDLSFKADQDSNDEVFRIGYFGIFSGVQKPNLFLEVMEDEMNKSSKLKFELHIYGGFKNFQIPYSLKNKVIFHNSLAYEEAIIAMNSMDANLVLYPRSLRKGAFSGKIFDYVSACKPIIAIVDTDDVAAQLVVDLNCGYIAEYSKKEEISAALRDAVHDRQKGLLKIASESDRTCLHRRHQVQKLIHLIRKLAVK